MSDFTNSREVRGKKQYRCALCGHKIRKGALHWTASGVYDGDFWQSRYHAVCLSRTVDWDRCSWESAYLAEDEFRKYYLRLPLLTPPDAATPRL